MNKQEYIQALKRELNVMPAVDLEERINFYDEIINDKIEEGLTEEEAVAQLDTPENAAAQILAEIPLSNIIKEKVHPSRSFRIWEIILIILGSPLWIPLLIATISIIFVLYAVIWIIILSIWTVLISIFAVTLAGIVSMPILLIKGNFLMASTMLGGGLICAGLGILFFMICKCVTKSIIKLTGKMFYNLKLRLIRKES